MEYEMKVKKGAFERIKSGRKRIEVRLYDEKRRQIELGDVIHFSKLPELREKVSTKVVGLLRYDSFDALLADVPMELFGYPEDYSRREYVEGMHAIHSGEKERQYGVLGIRIELQK